MDKFIISGGIPLRGEIHNSGSKNAVLPIMAATVIHPGQYRLVNVPYLRDTITMMRLLEMVGAKINFNKNIMDNDTSGCNKAIAPYDLVKTMRASFYMLGPFMSRFKYAEVSLPGGCAWGPRPVDYHLQAMEKMGAEVVAYDLSYKDQWDIVPYENFNYIQIIKDRKEKIRKLNNSFWFVHNALKSTSKVVYGNIYDIPEEIGKYDICTLGSILLHVRDPFLALQKVSNHTNKTIIITDIITRYK